MYFITYVGPLSPNEDRFSYAVSTMDGACEMPTPLFLCTTYNDARDVLYQLRGGVDPVKVEAWDFNRDGNGCVVRSAIMQGRYDASRPARLRIVHVTHSSRTGQDIEVPLFAVERPTWDQVKEWDAFYLNLLTKYNGNGSLVYYIVASCGGEVVRIAEVPE